MNTDKSLHDPRQLAYAALPPIFCSFITTTADAQVPLSIFSPWQSLPPFEVSAGFPIYKRVFMMMSILPAAGLFIVAGAGALPDLFEVVWNGGSAGCNARPDTMISLTPYATGFASNTTSVSLCRVYYRCTIYMHDGRQIPSVLRTLVLSSASFRAYTGTASRVTRTRPSTAPSSR